MLHENKEIRGILEKTDTDRHKFDESKFGLINIYCKDISKEEYCIFTINMIILRYLCELYLN